MQDTCTYTNMYIICTRIHSITHIHTHKHTHTHTHTHIHTHTVTAHHLAFRNNATYCMYVSYSTVWQMIKL